jgi:lipid-binding SYLF domain-containing protein
MTEIQMKQSRMALGATLLVLVLAADPLGANPTATEGPTRLWATVDAATEVLQTYAALPLTCLCPGLLHEAKGVAVIPKSVKLGLLLGGRFGRGVILVRQPDGCWGNPIFITLAGGGIGWQAGVQSTDIVLVFKTSNSLDRILDGKGKLTLGADAAAAVGPVGRQAEASTDGQLRAEIYSYSRSRGLFAGVSLEGAGLLIDFDANEAFYGVGGVRPADLMLPHVWVPPAAEQLKAQLTRMSTVVPRPVIYNPTHWRQMVPHAPPLPPHGPPPPPETLPLPVPSPPPGSVLPQPRKVDGGGQ